MRWLLVSSQHHPSHGGIGTYVTRLVAAAVEAGWQIDLITRPSNLHPAGATVHEIITPDADEFFAQRLVGLRRLERIRPYRYALWSRAVAEYVLKVKIDFDAVEFVDCQAEGYVSLCSRQVRRYFRGVPMIVHAHTPMFVEETINCADLSRFGRSIYHKWEREALRAADGVITTSKLLADRLPHVKRLKVIPYPIAAEPINRAQSQMSRSILLIGSAQPRKGVETWARSLNRVLHERGDATAMLIGSDTPTAPNQRSMIEFLQQVIEPKLRDRFQPKGALPHAEVQRMVSEAALVVVPSLFESFSFVAAEALMRGTPLIVSDEVGIAEHVPGLKAVPAGDVQALASAQLEMLDDLRQARQRAMSCRELLIESCAPAFHLQERAAFTDAIRAQPSAPNIDPAETDARDEIAEFIASVEQSERSLAMTASV